MSRLILVVLLSCFSASGATYYVTKAGNDTTGDGSVGTPWLTITKAAATVASGDTVMIGDGDYNEAVQETTAGVKYQASNKGLASLRAFRASAASNTLDGLVFTQFGGVGVTWDAAIRIEVAAHYLTVTNCTFKDTPKVYQTGFTFHNGGSINVISNASTNFVTAGITNGTKIYLGAISLAPFWHTNHDTTWVVGSLTATTLTVTNSAADLFASDPGTNYWASVFAGGSAQGFPAVNSILSGGAAASNTVIASCVVSNWMANAIVLNGDNHTVQSNLLTRLNSYRAFQYNGRNHRYAHNVVRNSPNILFFSETPSHTGTWYDYILGMTAGEASAGYPTNGPVVFEGNWFENLENDIGRVNDEQSGTSDITFIKNVFVGVKGGFDGGWDNMRWISNTFYRSAFEENGALQIGGRPPAQTGYDISRNLFIACGLQDDPLSGGYYGISTNATTPTTNYNMVAGEELTGWSSKTAFSEPNGKNGGDPVFLSVLDPDGPDNIPFTSDDGLQLVTNSPAAAINAGALGVYSPGANRPVAHFSVTSPVTWNEATGTNYNDHWWTNAMTGRYSLVRPYGTPQTIGDAPTNVTFSAAWSVSGVSGSTTNTGLWYMWNLPDRVGFWTNNPTLAYTFNRPGDHLIRLTVTNSSGYSHSSSNLYRVTKTSAVRYVDADYGSDALNGTQWRPWRSLNKASTTVVAGDYVLLRGSFGTNRLRTDEVGTSGSPIVFDGQGQTTVLDVMVEDPFHQYYNFTVSGYGGGNASIVWLRRGAHGTVLSNLTINVGYSNDMTAIGWESPTGVVAPNPGGGGGVPFGTGAASFVLVASNIVRNVQSSTGISVSGTNNWIIGNQFYDFNDSDFVRLFGQTNRIYGNIFSNIVDTPAGNHIDFIQTFGVGGYGSEEHIIERNRIYSIYGGFSQLEGNNVPETRNWIFRNNLYSNILNTASCSIPGVQYYNNTIFYCAYGASSPLTFGTRAYEKTNSNGYLVTGKEYYVWSTNGLGTATHGGVSYEDGDMFLAVSNGFASTGDTAVWYQERNYAHGGRVINNAFIFCGDGRTNRGWYGFEQTTPIGQPGLTNIVADYNYIVRTNYLPVQVNGSAQPIGAAGGWDEFKWYEIHGINGGNPNVVSFGTDWRPTTNSFLLGAGTNLTTWVTDDYLGDARTVPFTIGMFENAAGSADEPAAPATYNATISPGIPNSKADF